MSDHRTRSHVDRRAFLKASGLSLLSLGLAPSFLGPAAVATPASRASQHRKVLVTIFQRGAMDGLMAVPPLREQENLRRYRPNLVMPTVGESSLLDLGVDFGLHPAFASLLPLWRQQRLAIVHAVGSPPATRSHVEAQDLMETAQGDGTSGVSGWLNRVSGMLGPEATPFRSVALTSSLPRSLCGPEPALVLPEMEHEKEFVPLCGRSSRDLQRDIVNSAFQTLTAQQRPRIGSYRPAVDACYPQSALGRSLRQIAKLIKADVGLQIAFAESGGWDTHVHQGTTTGTFARRANDFADSLANFWTDLGDFQDDVLVLTMTEFGRTLRENRTGGTDHGHGSCLFALGNQVDGGKIHGTFPSLDEGDLRNQSALPVTTDIRAVFASAMRHLGVTDTAAVLPGWSGREMSLLQG